MSYVVGTKGQVVIAKAMRERLGVKPGWIALQRLVGDHLELRFIPPEHDRSLFGALSDFAIEDEPAWDEVRRRAWSAAARQEMEPTARATDPTKPDE